MSHVPPSRSGQLQPLNNAGGTILSTARPFGTAPAIDLTNPGRDYDTICKLGPQWIPVATLIKMGVLSRNGATLTENYATRQGGGGDGLSPRAFPL